MKASHNARKFAETINPDTRKRHFNNGTAKMNLAVTHTSVDTTNQRINTVVDSGIFEVTFGKNGRIVLTKGSVANGDYFSIVLRNSKNSPFMGDRIEEGQYGNPIYIHIN